MPLSSYHWVYCLRVSEADVSFNARILSSWWACRWPFELIWVRRWDMSENFCFLGQALHVSGTEVSGLTDAIFEFGVCPGRR